MFFNDISHLTLNKIKQSMFWLLLALLFLLPIPLGSNRPWAWSVMEIVSFILILGILLSHSVEQLQQQLKPFKFLISALAIFILYQALQLIPLPLNLINAISPNTALIIKSSLLTNDGWYALALDPQQAKIATVKALSYFCIMLATLVLVNDFKRLRALMLCLIFAGTWQAFYGATLALSNLPVSPFLNIKNTSIASGSFVYKNHFANFLILTLSVGIGYLVATLDKHKLKNRSNKVIQFLQALMSGKGALRIALAIMVIAIVLSRSRMGNTAFFVALTLTGILALWLMKSKSKSLMVLIVSLLVIDTFILGAYFGLDKVKQRLEQTTIQTEQRVDVNEYSLDLIRAFPLTGTGGGSFYSTFPIVQGNDIKSFYDHAHNEYVQFASEYGIPSLIWLGVLVLYSLIIAINAMRQRNSRFLRGLGFGAAMAIIGMLIHISVDFNLQAPANAAYFHVILALAWIANYGLHSSKTVNKF
ncbi:O-antigen ligase family protein [Thalassomonas sp. M1454]|uniref:O-antigen ligase family protein n=1 Tax=Thalassomonas sp. M1454 TaxID=2594477 RepID=UPI00117EA1D3|nr:O-antigen ligase family protein [Thalassomonas sp. M1454]TRX57218.1 O-antigen ligase family protein [Thalassomonas sp. M1454]